MHYIQCHNDIRDAQMNIEIIDPNGDILATCDFSEFATDNELPDDERDALHYELCYYNTAYVAVHCGWVQLNRIAD